MTCEQYWQVVTVMPEEATEVQLDQVYEHFGSCERCRLKHSADAAVAELFQDAGLCRRSTPEEDRSLTELMQREDARHQAGRN